MASENNNSTFRWYDFDVYGDSKVIKAKNAEALRSVYSALFKMMGHATGKEISLEDAVEWANQQGREKENGTLADILKKQLELEDLDEKKSERKDKKADPESEEEKRKKAIRDEKKSKRKGVSGKAKEKLEEMLGTGEITASQKAILEAYLQSYENYGTGARDNVLSSVTLLATTSMNARIGCGQGKTDISKGFAMAKAAEGKRTVITSSTPELAAQSYGELATGLKNSGLKAIYLSGRSDRFQSAGKRACSRCVSGNMDS